MDSIPAATNAQIFNLVLTNANTEYTQVLQDGLDNSKPSVKAIMLRLQNRDHTCQYSFKSSGPYFDLLEDEIYWKDGMDSYGLSIYIKSPDAGAIADIEVWY